MGEAQASNAAPAIVRATDRACLARRRQKRIYMRRWRSDPRHFEREIRTRLRAHLNRKMRSISSGHPRYLNRRGEPVCGFCWRRRPVKMEERLRVSEIAREGYVKVLIPCCGDC